MDTDGNAAAVDDHQVMLIGDGAEGHQLTCLVGDVERLDALGAAVGLAVVLDEGALAIALLTDYEDGLLGVGLDGEHPDDLVASVLIERHTTYPHSITPSGTYGILGEAHRAAVAVGDEHLLAPVGQCDIHQLVALGEVDGDDPVGTRAGVSLQQGLLDDPALGAEEQVV